MAAATNDSLLKRPLYVFDLPPELLQTFEPAIASAPPLLEPDQDGEYVKGNNATQELSDNDVTNATSCGLCNQAFSNVQEQRAHVRSDVHRYNIKQRQRGLRPVSEVEFDKLIGDLDESISGSDSSSSEDEEGEAGSAQDGTSKISSLLKRQARLDEEAAEDVSEKKRKRGSGKPPLLWFRSQNLPKDTTLGVYRTLFTQAEQASDESLVPALQQKQCPPQKVSGASEPPPNPPDGGVALPVEAPPPTAVPHIFLCMIGGGHFAAMVISLAPKVTKNHNSADARQATVLAHKTFHRYTTRRKQGGAQSANDNAKGNAHSAGSSLRRYNEEALVSEVQSLLREWRDMIDTSDLLFLRATGSTNRNTLFGPAKEDPRWPLRVNDTRLRGFPFSTRRATEAELMRCFVELTRAKIRVVDEKAERKAAEEAREKARLRKEEEDARIARKKEEEAVRAARNAKEQEAVLHTTQLTSLVRRNKAPALLSYLNGNRLDPSYRFYPPDHSAHYHAPTPLHLAASNNSGTLVTALLLKGGADPTAINLESKTPYDLAGDRATRDAFRVARTELGETKWNWSEAHVAEPLSRAEADQRAAQEKQDELQNEAARRQEGLEKLKEEEERQEAERKRRGDDRREQKHGKGKTVMAAGKERTAEERRADEARGMTPETKMRMEREKRARAVEERMRRMQQQS
ncbi:MAG: hypothetical protein Q9162_000067 [Coniocarpon cinnabarinum]